MHLLISGLVAAALFLHVDAARGTFVYAGCSPSRYAPNTAFESNLNSLLSSMAPTASSGATYSTFTAPGAGLAEAESPAAYGLYQCRGGLRPGECVACVRDTVARIGAVCAGAAAASLQSDGCYVRYGGASAAYHSCGAGTSGDPWFLRSRDAVLSELQGVDATAASGSGSGGYKVSASGPVRGAAQCLGGIAAGDCAACLAQAAAQLRGTCGAALAADVYLVQCSVRYWTDGANQLRSSQDNPEDDAGRTLAIAIGISAGVAALVVFISFLRKACSS
ncbi:plasmodesmata-located protein 8 [Zea mays]|uniref:Gnk2-homologous domain-containing protein n=1 Tax=Zea mays TaxID=4577 RepID=A0A804NTZ3_MAIZE|nr:plasmodesmata-located protein 8 [Zea mays]|eukprot:XP_008678881.1 cysteine-rich repeat secretory protein 15 [Zea mays]